MPTPLQTLDAFAGLRVLVIGEAMLDSYLHGRGDRLCREAPVPVVDLTSREDVPGGAANAAVNVAALGGQVRFLSVIGADGDGERLLEALEARGVPVDGLLRDPTRVTLLKQRVLAAGQLLLRLDAGSTEDVAGETERALLSRLAQEWTRADAVIISDYDYGVLTDAVVTQIAELQARTPCLLVVDARRPERYKGARPSAVKPNYAEAVRLLNLPPTSGRARVEQVLAHEHAFLEATGAALVALTLDASGAALFERGKPAYRTYTRPAPNANAAGAGDTFVAALTLALAAGGDTPAAADLASAAATVTLGRGGTSACTARELRAHLGQQDKLLSEGDLAKSAEGWRAEGKRVVFTNGCFDILHRGHVTYLNRAKALGDVLIVGLNSDASVRRLKGNTRPLNALEDRAQVLAALSCVDAVVPFGQDTPAELIELLRPDVYVKGGDYTRETLPEAPLVESLGGEVRLLTYLGDFSTTGLIERVRKLSAAGD